MSNQKVKSPAETLYNSVNMVRKPTLRNFLSNIATVTPQSKDSELKFQGLVTSVSMKIGDKIGTNRDVRNDFERDFKDLGNQYKLLNKEGAEPKDFKSFDEQLNKTATKYGVKLS